MKNETNETIALARKESEKYGLETKNMANSLTPEIWRYFKVSSLAEVSQQDLHDFCYRANISVASQLYALLRLRRVLEQKSIDWEKKFNQEVSSGIVNTLKKDFQSAKNSNQTKEK